MARMTTTTRLATPEDAPELAMLIHSAYRGDSSRQGWTTEADLLDGQRIDVDQVLAVIADPNSAMLVLPDDRGVLACCQLENRGAGLAYFGMFAVRPGRQGGGVGRRVMAEAQREARVSFGASAMELTVIGQRTELIAWYERLGFVRTGQTRPFPYGQVQFGVPQRGDLHFVVLRKELDDPRPGAATAESSLSDVSP
jgi:GNAT superfamily N-acetyltransferase